MGLLGLQALAAWSASAFAGLVSALSRARAFLHGIAEDFRFKGCPEEGEGGDQGHSDDNQHEHVLDERLTGAVDHAYPASETFFFSGTPQ